MATDKSTFPKQPTRWLEFDDCELPYWRIGTGPNLVLVHGWPVDSRTFRNLLPRLSQRYCCHLVDLPGAGLSKWDKNTRIGIAEGGPRLRQVIDKIGLDEYGLLAHDSGALFARHCAAGDPERVRALVMGNTEIPGHEPWQIQVMNRVNKLPGSSLLFRLMLATGIGRRSALGLGGAFADPSFGEGEFRDLFIKPLVTDRRKLLGQLRMADNFDFSLVHRLTEVHKQIVAPTRFVWGAQDPWFPLTKATAMVSQMGGPADFIVQDPGKVFIHEEFPQAFLNSAEPIFDWAFGLTSGSWRPARLGTDDMTVRTVR